MLRVTKLADYGIVMLTHLAHHSEHVQHNARDLSLEVGLPLPVVSKILKLLAREGLLISHRGTKGGYGLARPPSEISVAEIIRALEGPIAITECTDKIHGDCSLELLCPVKSNWHRINAAIHEALEKITLAEMAQPLLPLLVNLTERSPIQGFRIS